MDFVCIILLLVGFVLLIKGADYFVDGASELASKLGIPSMIIGLTIVAFGTSAPEAAVSVTSALTKSNAIAVSNIIGSNIFNLLAVIGLTSILYKIDIDNVTLKEDFPLLILSSILLLIFMYTTNTITQLEGIALLIILAVYIYRLIKRSKSEESDIEEKKNPLSPIKIFLYIILGIIGIVLGGNLVVENAKTIAISLGMSETLVGLTIVSIGTSLPELVTSITAALNKKPGIALGNAIGSCIFNILFILGLTNTISPIKTTNVMHIDTIIMIVLTIITFILAYDKEDFNRKDGIILVTLFIAYMIFIILIN